MQYAPERNKLPIGTQSFEILRSENNVYVDKTEYIYNLVTGGRVYFLSRPRRFGKSLLISTLEALFKGQRDLFKDAWIDSADYDWAGYPVIRIDMTKTNMRTPESFNESLIELLIKIADNYEVAINTNDDAHRVLNRLIDALEEKHNKVVVLIDEYDKPILDNITNESLAEEMRNTLRQFYSIFKAQDENLKFVMLTGITKFSKVSVFSGLNNLQDISMAEQYASLCGYTQNELEKVFTAWIDKLAEKYNTSVDEQLAKIKLWYNGYQFGEADQRVYNPFSVLLVFQQKSYKPFWFDTGTPTFLVKLMEKQSFSPNDIESLSVSASGLQNYDVERLELVALLYQTGYLTIKNFNPKLRIYHLGYPNFEVKDAFNEVLLIALSETSDGVRGNMLVNIDEAIERYDYEGMILELQSFFSAMPYELHQPTEKYYQSIFYTLFKMINYRVGAEVSTNIGRLDAVIELIDRVLIFEFKINQTAEAALQQIHDKRYYKPYQNQGKAIILFGVNFSTAERNITDWRQESI